MITAPSGAVKRPAYTPDVDYREAVDAVAQRLTHEELAKRLGVSVATLRQAKLPDDANAYRNPPKGWDRVLIQVAEERARYFADLAARLRSEAST